MKRTAEDILKEAILLETRGKTFYKTVAEKCDSPSAKKIFEMMEAADRVADGMEQSWITAHVFQSTCLLTDVLCPTCGETRLYISVCEGSDQRARFALKKKKLAVQ